MKLSNLLLLLLVGGIFFSFSALAEPNLREMATVPWLREELEKADVKTVDDLRVHYLGTMVNIVKKGALVYTLPLIPNKKIRDFYENHLIPFKSTPAHYRYLYSRRWGWLDVLHFTTGAWMRLQVEKYPEIFKPLHFSGKDILLQGENNENSQKHSSGDAGRSVWSYEDLPSNLMGVYFAKYLKKKSYSKENYEDILEKAVSVHLWEYLSDLGFETGLRKGMDDLISAPNYKRLPEDTKTSSGIKSKSYFPLFAPDHPPLVQGIPDQQWNRKGRNDTEDGLLHMLHKYLEWKWKNIRTP